MRQHGVCRGSLWRQEGLTVSSVHPSGDLEYARVFGSVLETFESLAALSKGDAPLRSYDIVGASAMSVKAFRLVTNQGTHVTCQTLSQACRDLWLASLHAGLERSLLQEAPDNARSFERPGAQTAAAPSKKRKPSSTKYCHSCGALEDAVKRPVLSAAAPLFQYSQESRCDVCHECLVAQGVVHHLRLVASCMEDARQERAALHQVWNLCWQTVTTSGAASSSPSVVPEATATPGSPEAEDKSSNSSNESWTHVDPLVPEGSWIQVEPSLASTKALIDLLQSASFGSWTRVSPFLQGLADDLVQGRIGVPDFMEQLDEAVGRRETHSRSALKKQAFLLAGDMGSAMKLLLDHSLPKRPWHATTADKTVAQASLPHNLDLLTCVLEFMLDLCDEGDLSAVAFFWPQLCHLHLCMLPATNAADVARVELIEDFLLTVTTRYSIHLALELVWSHTADLEESLATIGHCSAACRSRRFAVLSFVCELESHLFGYEEGWGGGSVCLGKMLVATGHQLELMQATMKTIQGFRKSEKAFRLKRSARYDLLVAKSESMEPEVRAFEKLKIAKNADYYSGHLNFTKRLSDIAEKLWHMDAPKRTGALEEELNLLNSSGAMGGDPLNRVRDEYVRVVRVPCLEGHVFRSKERTPVLLLMELLDEGADEESLASKPQPPPSTTELEGEVPLEVTIDSSEKATRDELITPLAVDIDDTPSIEMLPPQEISEDPDVTSLPAQPLETDLEGASDPSKPSSRIGALKKFRSDFSETLPLSPKVEVQAIVCNALAEKMLTVPELGTTADQDTPSSPVSAAGQKETPVKGPKSMPLQKTSDVPVGARKMFFHGTRDTGDGNNALAPTSDIRREVLNVIMMKGKKGNTIAARTADSVQRSLKELERKRATELLLRDDDVSGEMSVTSVDIAFADLESTQDKLLSLGFAESSSRSTGIDLPRKKPSEEDEVMEAVRLLLIQNRVAQGQLSPADAQKVLQHVSLSRVQTEKNEKPLHTVHPTDMPTVDAGDLDPRLAGCGPLPPAVLQALTLWKGDMVTNGELLELVKKDIEFVRHSVLLEAENVDKLNEDSAFWGRFAFGERWAEKRARIAASSPQGSLLGWNLVGVIVKSNDDLRQEAFVMQLIELCQEAFDIAGLELWVNPYRILATGRTTGVIEMVRNAMSFDALKKRPGYGKGGLREHLQRMTEFTADPGGAFKSAQRNFVRSLAAYCLMSYIFLFKDRHNGNILLDTAGHVIHIDFGFVFGVAPGGSFSLELSTPFKLTDEMVEVMGGLRSPLFSEFVTLFCCGFLALQSYCDTFLTLVEITCKNSTFKCFEGRESEEVVAKLRERFAPDLSKEETIVHALDLIHQATTSYGTRQYDLYQYMSQGIAT